jgi:hypothetical protein
MCSQHRVTSPWRVQLKFKSSIDKLTKPACERGFFVAFEIFEIYLVVRNIDIAAQHEFALGLE